MPFPMRWGLQKIISVEFWIFSAISSKCSFGELCPNLLWTWGNRKHEFYVALDIPLNFHHECFFHDLALQTFLLVHGDSVAKHEFYVQFWIFYAIPREENIFFIDSQTTPMTVGWWTCFFCTNLDISFNSCIVTIYKIKYTSSNSGQFWLYQCIFESNPQLVYSGTQQVH